MTELDTLRAEILSLFPAVVDELGEDLTTSRRPLLNRSRARLAAGRYLVVVCGEFRRGKSSLLNALVDRKALFPVDVDVTTSVVTTLEWGEHELAVVYFAAADESDAATDGTGDPATASEPMTIPLSAVAEFVTEQANPRNKREVASVAMSAPIEQLRGGLGRGDTPGMGSLNPAHTAATRLFLPRADAVLFVCSAVEPPGTVELDFLAEAVEQCPTVLAAVTMTDRVAAPEPAVEAARDRIARRVSEVTGADAGAVVVVGVSALRKRTGAVAGDDAKVAASGFPELEAALWDGLAATCGATQLGGALEALGTAVDEAQSPLLTELAALDGDGALDRIDAEVRSELAKVKDLRSGGNRWRRNLADELETDARAVRDRLGVDFDAIRDRFRVELGGPDAVSDPQAVVGRVSTAVVDAVNRAEADLADVVGEVAMRYLHTTAVTLRASGTPATAFGSRLGEVEVLPRSTGSGHRRFRAIWGGGSAGAAAVGAALWAVSFVVPVAPLVGLAGTVLGLVSGLFGGARHHAETERARQDRAARQHLRDQVQHRIDAARRAAERDLADRLRDATRDLTAALDDHLAASAEAIEKAVADLKATRARTAEERTTRRRLLEQRRDRYTALLARLDALEARVAALLRPEQP